MGRTTVLEDRVFNAEGSVGWFYVPDFGRLKADGKTDDLDVLLKVLAIAGSYGGGRVVLPGGGLTVMVRSTVLLPSNVYLYIPVGTTIRLMGDANVDLVANAGGSSGNTNLGIFGGGTLDSNRANNTGGSGTRGGVLFEACTRVYLSDIEIARSYRDGLSLIGCEYGQLENLYVHDCGRHGINLTNSQRIRIVAPLCVDCCRVAATGTGDGINADLLSSECSIEGPVVEDTYSNSPTMGYGIREAASSLCERNQIIGGTATNMQTGRVRLESGDSSSLMLGAMNLPSGVVITP